MGGLFKVFLFGMNPPDSRPTPVVNPLATRPKPARYSPVRYYTSMFSSFPDTTAASSASSSPVNKTSKLGKKLPGGKGGKSSKK